MSRRLSRPLKGLVLVAVAAAGVGLFVGGNLAARESITAGRVGHDLPPPMAPPSTSSTTPTAPASTTTIVPITTTTTAPPDEVDGVLELGEGGPEVRALQERLSELGYWLGAPDGHYGQLTRQAVMAFQKAEGLGRDGVAGPTTQAALASAARPAPAEPSGSHLEIDLARQILLVVDDGQTRWVLNTSTGSGETYPAPGGGKGVAITPAGHFRVQREIDALRQAPLGALYRPKYFHGGIAIHGAGKIPAHPASHGCARVTNSAMDLLWTSGMAAIGTPVVVH